MAGCAIQEVSSHSISSQLQVLTCLVERPEKHAKDNEIFNYHLSAVRIRSEHCVGFWKGRFPSLRGLRLEINNVKQLYFATYWIIATIAIHNFAIQHESGGDILTDDFFRGGMRDLQEDQAQFVEEAQNAEEEATADENSRATLREVELLRARLRREELKAELLDYLNSDN